tara:strand:- start:1935 stop:2228 length:294 start_codon:yes stop_codon:yes gene_type:complete
MNYNKLFFTGVTGTVIVALCCFTPVLVVLLGVVGLSAATGYLDYVLLPALALLIGITAYAFIRKQKSTSKQECCDSQQNEESRVRKVDDITNYSRHD